MTVEQGWNPRYRRYAAVHGRTPGEQLRHDAGLGSTMLPFITWMHAAWDAFDEAHGISSKLNIDKRRTMRFERVPRRDPQAAFDAWLATYAEVAA